ncbi:hypothetical protein BH11PLA1_BH11PLA1_18540 [soil metagenome]
MVALTNNPAAPEPAPILPADFNHTLALAKLNALTIVSALLADAETPPLERRRLAALILRANFLPMPKPLTLAEAMRLETNPDSPWGANADYSDDTVDNHDEDPSDDGSNARDEAEANAGDESTDPDAANAENSAENGCAPAPTTPPANRLNSLLTPPPQLHLCTPPAFSSPVQLTSPAQPHAHTQSADHAVRPTRPTPPQPSPTHATTPSQITPPPSPKAPPPDFSKLISLDDATLLDLIRGDHPDRHTIPINIPAPPRPEIPLNDPPRPPPNIPAHLLIYPKPSD